MEKLCLSNLEWKVLQIIQTDFPIAKRPYRQLAQQVDSSEEQVIAAIRNLMERGVIRELSPVFELRRLGYTSTLAAAAVPPERVEQVAACLNEHPEVTHCYLRDHDKYNLWFTIIAPSEKRIDDLLAEIEVETDCPQIQNLPAEHVFEINVVFDFDEERYH